MKQCEDCGKEITKVSTRCASCAMKKRWEDPEFRARMSEKTKRQWENSEFRKKQAELKKRRWEDPEYRKMMSETTKQQWEDPEFREMQAKLLRWRWEDSEFRTMMSETTKQQWEDPEFRATQARLNKERWENPEYRMMMSQKAIKQLGQWWEEPEYRAKMSKMSRQQWEDPEYRAILSEYSKQRWGDPGFRARKTEQMLGENNPNWQGGTSFEPYSPEWTDELKEEIRERDEYTCAMSGEVWQKDQPTFHVHHIDADKKNCERWNLITLSPSSHAKANADPHHWQALLTHIAKGAEMQVNAFVDGF